MVIIDLATFSCALKDCENWLKYIHHFLEKRMKEYMRTWRRNKYKRITLRKENAALRAKVRTMEEQLVVGAEVVVASQEVRTTRAEKGTRTTRRPKKP